jgi:hypothetical protein
MSRTFRKEKGPGYEYWYKEANTDGKRCNVPGKFSKKIIKRRNRRNSKNNIKEQLEN